MLCSILSTGFEKYSQRDKYQKSLSGIVELLYFKGGRDFLLPAAPGIPLWTGEIICEMKKYLNIGLRLYLPFEEATIGWPPKERNEFYAVREQADSLVFLNRKRSEGSFYECEKALADVCDILVLIDGDIASPCDRSIVKYARENKITLLHEII